MLKITALPGSVHLYDVHKNTGNGTAHYHLGLATWQKPAFYVGPPLVIAVVVIWRAVYKATTHPDQKLLKKEERDRDRDG